MIKTITITISTITSLITLLITLRYLEIITGTTITIKKTKWHLDTSRRSIWQKFGVDELKKEKQKEKKVKSS